MIIFYLVLKRSEIAISSLLLVLISYTKKNFDNKLIYVIVGPFDFLISCIKLKHIQLVDFIQP